MSLGYSIFSIEHWPEDAQAHFLKHLSKGTLVCNKMPADTFDQRHERMSRHLRFYMRCKVHISRMHPGLSL